MSITVRGTKGRKSVTATGDSRPQAQGRALAEWRRKYDEVPKGVRFEVVDAAEDKPKRKAKAKAAKPAEPAAAPSKSKKADKPKPQGPVVPIDGIESGDYLVVGVTSGGRVDEVLASSDIAGAKALAHNGAALKGSHRLIVRLDYVLRPKGRTIPGDARLKPDDLEYLSRVVLGLDGGKRLINAESFTGSPDQARAVGDAMSAVYAVIGAVLYVIKP